MLETENSEIIKTFFPDMQIKDNRIIVYDSVSNEYKALISGAAFRDLSDEGVFELKGADTLKFLNRISTSGLKEIAENKSAYTLFTNEKGKIIDKALIVNAGASIFLISSGAHYSKLNSWLNKYIASEDIKISSPGRYFLHEISGSQAESFLILVFGTVPSEYNVVKKTELEGISYYLIRTEDQGISRYYVWGEKQYSGRLFEYMMENKMIFDFFPVGSEAYEIFRIERGLLAAPSEICDKYSPNDSNLYKLVSQGKEKYIGQETIARGGAYGKGQWIFCSMELDMPAELETLQLPVSLADADGGNAGSLTSAVFSPYLGRKIGLGYVKTEIFAEGKILRTANDKASAGVKVTLRSAPFKK